MKRKLALIKASSPLPAKGGGKALLGDVRAMILEARQTVARGVNAALVVLYWNIGQRIRRDILREKRAEYGERIVAALGRQLEREFGRGFTRRNVFNMVRFAEVFSDGKIVHALSAQLGWTHLRRIIYLDDPLKRDFYAEMCRIERWNVRTLRSKIGGMLFERTALSRKPEELVEYLYRNNSFPHGCFLLTGTGVVPPDSFTLKLGDEIRITIPPIGTLLNTVG